MSKSIFPIVGMKHRGPEAESLVRELKSGDQVRLVRDPQNQVDRNAVMVMVGVLHVGFIPAAMAARLAPGMDAHGKTEIVGTFAVGGDRRPCVEIIEEERA
jgi:hypothetical protein